MTQWPRPAPAWARSQRAWHILLQAGIPSAQIQWLLGSETTSSRKNSAAAGFCNVSEPAPAASNRQAMHVGARFPTTGDGGTPYALDHSRKTVPAKGSAERSKRNPATGRTGASPLP